MKKRTIIVIVIAIMMCANLTSCSSNNNKIKEGQKALDAAVKREVNAANIQNRTLKVENIISVKEIKRMQITMIN